MNNDPLKIVENLVVEQEKKVKALARRLVPHLTDEDLLNPQDFPDLVQNAHFNYEDGYLAALRAVKIALSARF